MSILKHLYTITYEMSIDSDTGEIVETKIVNKDTVKPAAKKVVEEDNEPEPRLVLEENKYRLNNAAISLMNLNENSKLVIKYESVKNNFVPIIGTAEAFGMSSGGNKLTKSNTVACRGSNRDELAKYGERFTITPHSTNANLFVLTSTTPKEEIKEEVEDLPFDLNINDELVENQDVNINEISADFFKF